MHLLLNAANMYLFPENQPTNDFDLFLNNRYDNYAVLFPNIRHLSDRLINGNMRNIHLLMAKRQIDNRLIFSSHSFHGNRSVDDSFTRHIQFFLRKAQDLFLVIPLFFIT
ncbi:hypothetical protein HA48_10080 [Pantoea wallisii]|uniref:Uncharacterized protein n=1 Tax=Pantoea wallisii TaxID=1076551 RepID=A0A1X1D9M2_9GAMM|nr:hypothetical protein HA48_10080 [Pantoea wallisii]